jgi:hypothetical protein
MTPLCIEVEHGRRLQIQCATSKRSTAQADGLGGLGAGAPRWPLATHHGRAAGRTHQAPAQEPTPRAASIERQAVQASAQVSELRGSLVSRSLCQ